MGINHLDVLRSLIKTIDESPHENPIGNALDQEHFVGKKHFEVVRIELLHETLPVNPLGVLH